MHNQIEVRFSSLAENEAFARMVISALIVQVNPPLNVVAEVRTAVSEAITNAVVHAYPNDQGSIIMRALISEKEIHIEVEDYGCGIDNVDQAMTPFFTTKPDEERTGIGFSLMQSFMDKVAVTSAKNNGTLIQMSRNLLE